MLIYGQLRSSAADVVRKHNVYSSYRAAGTVRDQGQARFFEKQHLLGRPPDVRGLGRRRCKQRGFRKPVQANGTVDMDPQHGAPRAEKVSKGLTVGVIGFGTFGRFLARRLVSAGHRVIATSRSNYTQQAAEVGAEFFQDIDDFCEEHPDVVILATSILSTQQTLESVPMQRLRRSTLFVDVLSVKEFPKHLMLERLPYQMDILCTHPMFGPDSGKGSWAGLNFMFEKVRIGPERRRHTRVETFINFFANEGCRMVEMSCEEHDRKAASSQFVTHTVGRMLGEMALRPTEIDTKGFQALLNLVDNTANDSFDLYYGLFMYNQNATEELVKLEEAFDSVKRQLFKRLHEVLREEQATRLSMKPPRSQATGGTGRRQQQQQQPQAGTSGVALVADKASGVAVGERDAGTPGVPSDQGVDNGGNGANVGEESHGEGEDSGEGGRVSGAREGSRDGMVVGREREQSNGNGGMVLSGNGNGSAGSGNGNEAGQPDAEIKQVARL